LSHQQQEFIMDEETKSKDARQIKLTQDQYNELERAMQWPEDLAQWDKNNTPTNFGQLLGNLTAI
jgi:hypothetical protein